MRVLFVTHGMKDTTTAVYRNELGRAQFLERLGHVARVLAPADVGVAHHGRLLPITFPFAAAWWILRQAPFDAIAFHSHTACVYQLVRRCVPRQRKTRVMVVFHGLDILYVRALAMEAERRGSRQSLRFRLLHAHLLPALARWSCRRAARVFCTNDRERQFLVEHRWTDDQRVRRMPNCVSDDDFVDRQPALGPVRLLMVAQWLPVKGTQYAVEAFTSVVRKGLDIQLTCAGTRYGVAEVLRAFPEDVRGRVSVVPQAAHDQIRQLYAAADLFMLASISEGFSFALLEAMAAGLAIVTTNVGAAAEILEGNRDATLVPSADAAALASAIEALVADPARRREYGERARQRARAFTCERIYPRFVEELLGTAAQVAAPALT